MGLSLVTIVLLLSPPAPGPACPPELRAVPPREAPPWDSSAPYDPLHAGSPSADGASPLGIGHVAGAAGFWWGEARHVRLPLHARPGAEPWGWFIDGWLRLRLAPSGSEHDGTAWLHRCHLARETLRVEPWSERLTSDEISPLFFRDGRPHALRASPDEHAEPRARVRGDHHLEPLELRGDWMRVRLTQPSDYCDLDERSETRTEEGWVRWFDGELGPLVRYHTRGC